MDLGLELLMNPRKKVQSDASSVRSSDVSSVKSIRIAPQHMREDDVISQITGDDDDQSSFEESIKVNEMLSDNVSERSYRSHSSRRSYKAKKRVPPSPSYTSEGTVETEDDDASSGSDIHSLGSMLAKGERNHHQQHHRPSRMSEEEVINAKREILYQFDRLERKGMKLPKKFTMASNLDEMRHEYERLKRDRDMDNAVKFQRKALMMFTSGVEFVSNSRFIPINTRLDGWSESVHESIDEYDEIFEDLYEKYKGKAQMAPELKLLMTLGGSAFMFHVTNALCSKAPGLEQILKSNPDLMKQFAAATANTMKEEQPQGSFMGGLMGMFSNLMGGGMGSRPAPPEKPQYVPSQPQQTSFNMKGPSDIDEIMRNLEQNDNDNDRIETFSTVTSSEFTELQDDASISNLVYKKKKKGSVGGGRTVNLDI